MEENLRQIEDRNRNMIADILAAISARPMSEDK